MIRLQTRDRKEEIVFNNQPYVLNQIDLGAATISVSTLKGIAQVGEYLNSASVGTRQISITGYILANSQREMRERKRDLVRVMSPTKPFYLIVDNYKLECVAIDSVKYAIARHENNDQLAKFVLTAKALNPCFSLLEDTTVKIALWRGLFHFPLTLQASKPLVIGVREPAKIANVENGGDIATGFTVEFKAKGALTNPHIFNLESREQIKINKALVAGEVVRVSTNYGDKTVKGALNGVESNYFKYLDIDSSFFQLNPGENNIKWGADTNEDNLEVSIIFSPQFLGV